MRSRKLNFVSITFIVVLLCQSVHSQLQIGFSRNSCILVELIVKDAVRDSFIRDHGIAAGLVKLHFSDCFVRTRGPGYDVPSGRRDGKISLASDTFSNLPTPSFNVDQLTQIFDKKGFTQEEMVIEYQIKILIVKEINPLLTNTMIFSNNQCLDLINRLYNFNGTKGQDPSLDFINASWLKRQRYYISVLANRGLFTSYQILMTNTTTANQVNQSKRNPLLWRSKFAGAMVKMGQLDVLTGNAGEKRSNCKVINS
ncbi:hypothetical protein ACB098_12G025800 [Castanea mollissima]